jgi:hypothetical protein
MNLLLDSHALLWALHDPTKMRPEAVEAIRDRDLVCYSAASVWELELKVSRGKLSLPEDWLDAAEAAGFLHLPITALEALANDVCRGITQTLSTACWWPRRRSTDSPSRRTTQTSPPNGVPVLQV